MKAASVEVDYARLIQIVDLKLQCTQLLTNWVNCWISLLSRIIVIRFNLSETWLQVAPSSGFPGAADEHKLVKRFYKNSTIILLKMLSSRSSHFFVAFRSHSPSSWCLRQLSLGAAASGSSGPPKTGIVMLNMGGPSTVEEVEPFLTRLFTDKDIIPLPAQSKLGPLIARRRSPKVAEKYKQIGGGSPIRAWTEKQGKLMTELLDQISPGTAPHKFYIGFRYADPLLENTLADMQKDGITRAVAFSQYPQYSCATSGSSFNQLAKYYRKNSDGVKWSFIDRWPLNEGLVEAFADLTRKEIQKFPDDVRNDVVLLFSAHSLPLRAVSNGDPYPTEVGATVVRVMEKLNFRHPYRLVWQSKVGPLPWLSPHTDDAIKGFVEKGRKNFLIVPISFVNEHIETLHELDIEYAKELGEELKVNAIRRVPAPNDHPAFIKGLAHLVKDHLSRGELCSPQLHLRCPMCTKASCFQMREWLKALSL